MTDATAADAGPTFGPADDDFHDVGPQWWATETAWFSFHHHERRLGGWLYVLARPNIGTVQGGAWVWDDSAFVPWEVLYSANFSSMPLPDERSLADVTLRTGVSIKVVEALDTYRLGYRDPGRFEADLLFSAVMPPHGYPAGEPPFLSASHFDQLGRISGTIRLPGESIDIDCYSMRDRSWGPRPEHRPRRLAYCFGTASPQHAFFCTLEPAGDSERINHGFLIREGVKAALVAGTRTTSRDPRTGVITTEIIVGTDARGRDFTATGTPVSRIAINRHTAITWNYLSHWRLDNVDAWGEDQDMWPVHDWSDFVRSRRSGPI
jgi:hypothetical protein